MGDRTIHWLCVRIPTPSPFPTTNNVHLRSGGKGAVTKTSNVRFGTGGTGLLAYSSLRPGGGGLMGWARNMGWLTCSRRGVGELDPSGLGRDRAIAPKKNVLQKKF